MPLAQPGAFYHRAQELENATEAGRAIGAKKMQTEAGRRQKISP